MMKMIVLGVWCVIAAGFLHGGKRWVLGIAMFMLFLMVMQVMMAKVLLERAARAGRPVDGMFWGEVVIGVLLCGVPAVCGIALYVRARRAR